MSYFFWRASFFFFPRPSRSMPFALSLFSSLSTCERQKDVNSLCLVAIRASDQHVAAEGHEVEGRAGHLVVGERERATERTEDASRTDASRRREQGLSLGEVCLSPCSFVTAERGKRRPGALLWGPVRAPVEARRARAKLKRLPLSVSQERFFSLPLGRRQSCALSSLIRGGRENSVIFFSSSSKNKMAAQPPAAALRLLGSALRRLGSGVDALGAAVQGRFASPEGGEGKNWRGRRPRAAMRFSRACVCFVASLSWPSRGALFLSVGRAGRASEYAEREREREKQAKLSHGR